MVGDILWWSWVVLGEFFGFGFGMCCLRMVAVSRLMSQE